MPYYKDDSLDLDLIWYMDFSDGLHQIKSDLTGYNGATSDFQIQTDNQMGTYLQCTRVGTSNSYKVYWAGSKDYLNSLISNTAPFSVCFWLRAPNWTSYSNQVIMCCKTNDSGTGLVMYRDGGQGTKIDARLSYQNNFFTSTATQNSNWVHWAFVRDSSGAKWYCNGVVDNTNSSYGSLSNTASQNFTIGYCAAWSCNAYFDVTKFRIYKRALTADQVANLYNKKA